MSRPTVLRAAALTSLAAFGLSLAACGKTGELQRPRPLFGAARATPADQEQTQGQDPSRPVNTVDPRDQGALDPSPPRTAPIQGQGQDPLRARPPGAIPDPYARPQ